MPIQECFSKISSIIFGCSCPESDKKMIMKIFENKKDKPAFKQAVFDTKENFLNIIDYNKK